MGSPLPTTAPPPGSPAVAADPVTARAADPYEVTARAADPYEVTARPASARPATTRPMAPRPATAWAGAAHPAVGAAFLPPLLVIAHGSRDPRHAATVRALTRRVAAARPGLRVETAFLDFGAPSVPVVVRRLAAQGVREAVALPLLLTRAFHAKADIPAVLREAAAPYPSLRLRTADVLGPSPLLIAALERRLYQAGLRPGERSSTGVVLASAGSTDPEASAVIAAIAREWRRTGWCAVRPAFASACLPRTEDAVRQLRAEGVRRIAVAPYVIAPGFLPDRIARGAEQAGADVLADVLGPAPELAELLLRRYDEASSYDATTTPVRQRRLLTA